MSVRAKPKLRKTAKRSPARRGRYEIVVVGASAGGLLSLFEILRPLGTDFSCAILVVMHLDPSRESIVSELLSRASVIPVKQASDGEEIKKGLVYIGPPNRHLVVGSGGMIALSDSEPIHHSRPAVDVLFESAALQYGARCIAVVLSGSLSDGARGLQQVKHAGGTTMVEDPLLAQFKGMPQSAVATGCVDYVLPVHELGPKLIQLCTKTR